MKSISLILFSITALMCQEFQFKTYISQAKINQRIQLPDTLFIIPNSETVSYNVITLQRLVDYKINYSSKQLEFLKNISMNDTLHISFSVIPVQKEYRISTKPQIYTFSTIPDSNQIFIKTDQPKAANVFSRVNANGSLYRGFRLSTDQNLKLESGLNLSLDGNLSKDVKIKASIRDETTPIQPEGSTQNLSEIDKIYINIDGPEFETTVGDFDYQAQSDDILDYSRRLNGISVTYKPEFGRVGGLFSTTRSKFHTDIQLTQDGLQGPYKLSSPSNNQDILIIAGSEKVYLNGQLQKRGRNNDYIIEYANGTIRFTSKRLIRANQRLEVEFEFVEALQRFGRNVLQAHTSYASNNFKTNFTFIEESDDIDNPLSSEQGFTDNEKEILASAGSNTQLAQKTGITLSNNGNTGLYNFEAIAGDSILVYQAERNGRYNVIFSNVGSNQGDYRRVSRFENQYEFAGKKQGDYDPVIQIPIPEKKSILLNKSELNYAENNSLKLSTAASINDANVLSELDDDSNNGLYFKLHNNIKLNEWQGLKDIEFATTLQYRSRYFESLNRNAVINQLFEYGFNQNDRIANQRQFKQNISAGLGNSNHTLQFTGIEHGADLKALKLMNSHSISTEDKDRRLSVSGDFLDTQDDFNQKFQRYKSIGGELNQTIDQSKLTVDYTYNRRSIKDAQLNGIQNNRLQLSFSSKYKSLSQFEYTYIFENQALRDTLNETKFLNFSSNNEHRISFDIRDSRLQNSTIFSIRDRSIDPFFQRLSSNKSRYFNTAFVDSNFANNRSILIENKLSYRAYNRALSVNFNYRAGSELSAKRELVYQKVTSGFGNYRQEGDRFIPDSKGDFIRFVLPSNEFEPVTKINVLFQLKFDPIQYKFKPAIYNSFLNYLSFQSRLNVLDESKSEDRTSLYLLKPSALLSDQSSNGSLQFFQYVYINRQNQNLFAELFYRNSQNVINTFVNDVSGENNRNRSNEIKTTLHYKPFDQLKLKSDFSVFALRKSVSDSSFNRNISGYQLSQSINYFITRQFTLTNTSELAIEENKILNQQIKVKRISNISRLNYRLNDKGNIRAEINFTEVSELDNPLNLTVPFEMANGKQLGVNREWEISALYRLSNNLNVDFNYSGRKDVIDLSPINIMRLEVRLLF